MSGRPVTFDRRPILPPGICYKCRCGGEVENRNYFVDMGVDTEFDGVLYFCDLCLKDIVRIGLPDIVLRVDVNKFIDDANEASRSYHARLAEMDLIKDHLTKMGMDWDTLVQAATPVKIESEGDLIRMQYFDQFGVDIPDSFDWDNPSDGHLTPTSKITEAPEDPTKDLKFNTNLFEVTLDGFDLDGTASDSFDGAEQGTDDDGEGTPKQTPSPFELDLDGL